MRVFAIINGYTGALCLRELLEQGHEVVGVVTSPGATSSAPPSETVVGVAARNMLPLYMPPLEMVKEPSEKFVNLLRRAKPDLIVSMHYPAIFKDVLLNIPPLGCVNIHPSKLPEGRGMTPSFWYLYLGRNTAWTCLHYLDPGVDSGDVIAFAPVAISQNDTGTTISRRLSEAALEIFREHLPAIMAGNAPRQKQDLSKGSYLWAGRNWNLIKWQRKAEGVRGQIRCFTGTSNPAYTYLGGLKLLVNDAVVADPGSYPMIKKNALPGEFLAMTSRGPLIQTGRRYVVLTDFSLEDEKASIYMTLAAGNVPVIFGS